MTTRVESYEKLCAAIVQQCADAMIFADRDGRIRLWNDAAERLFGYAAEQAVGQSLDIVIPEHLREALGGLPHGHGERCNKALRASNAHQRPASVRRHLVCGNELRCRE